MKDNKDSILPEGFTVGKLKEYFNIAKTEYSTAHKRAVKLDATDRGKLWEAVIAVAPPLVYTLGVAPVVLGRSLLVCGE